MTHHLKLNYHFADAVYSGEKCFEVRENDRGFQKGDRVIFHVIDDVKTEVYSPLCKEVYEITYILSGWHIDNGYVVFGIKRVEDKDE